MVIFRIIMSFTYKINVLLKFVVIVMWQLLDLMMCINLLLSLLGFIAQALFGGLGGEENLENCGALFSSGKYAVANWY